MKCAMIFTVSVIVGLSIVSGSVSRKAGNDPIIPRPNGSSIVDPFAPIGIASTSTSLASSVDEALPVQQSNANTTEWTTTANPPIIPSQYDGDVRDVPPVPARERAEDQTEMYEPHDPPSMRAGSALKGSNAAREILDVANNVPLGAMPPAIQSFQGMSLNDNCAGAPCGIGQPPDANGDVGLDHYIEAVNFGLAIYSKSGNLLARFSEASLWRNANTGTPCDAQSHGDPVVIYDQFANRWIISNFAFGFNQNGPTSPFYECFAVSKTGDPVSGGWWLYPVRTDNGGSQPPVGAMGDYPKFGNWNDGCLYMSANNFTFPGGRFVGTMFGSFNKSDMENGQPLTSSIGFISDANTSYSMIPSNLSGAQFSESLPANGTPNYYAAQSRGTYSFEIRKFTSGTSPKICGAGGSMSAPVNVAQTAWSNPGDISQPNATVGSLGERLMQKVQYRKVGTKESLWIVHSVEATANTTVRSQWVQIDVSGGAVKTSPVQQQIYAPDTTIERWVPSIAADHDGNVAIGYNLSSGSVFPGIAYAGRLATDPLNQLPQGETVLVAGNGSQRNQCEGGPCRRWGDYSAMSIDPVDDCTFWYVNQYYDGQSNGDSGNWQTRIGSFKFPSCGGHLVTHTLNLQSANPTFGVPITIDLDDENDKNNGIVPFTRTYRHGYTVRVTTDPKALGNSFLEWQRDGVSYSRDISTTVVIDGDHTMKAVYDSSTTRSLTLKSLNPNSGVSISLTPGDVFNVNTGNTGFEAKFSVGTPVTVKAPATAGGNVFKRWMVDGYQWDTATTTVLPLDNDHEMTAVYEPVSTVTVTVQTNPSGARFTVDGASYSSSQTFSWAPNSTHTMAADETTSTGAASRLAWSNWSDGGAISHTVTASGPTTYTANFKTQFLLTINVGDGGVVRPLTGFYNAREPVSLIAEPQTRFSFDGWVGTGVDSYTGTFANIAIDMTAPVTETANFSLVDTTIQLSSATYSASETAGFFNVTVVRNGPPTNTDSVSYITTDGTAKEGRDYVVAQGVVSFALGESTKTFPILLINNSYVDASPRTVNIKLIEAQGAFLGTTSSAVLSIVDDDKSPGPNPVDDAHAFVQFNYFDFLGRFPDTGGWDFWTNEIKSCGSNQACVDVKRTNVSGAFFLSTEFQQTGYLVERIYKVSYGDAPGNSTLGGAHQLRVPVIRFAEFLAGKEAVGRGVIVGQNGWEDLLENNKQDFVRALIRTQRFFDAFPNTMTPAQFVDKLNQNAGNVLTPGERNDAIALFEGTPDSSDIRVRRHALLAVAEAPELVAAEKNRAFVLAQYYGYLRRNPDDPPDKPGDYTGYDFWLSKLNQFNGDFVAAQMVQAFLGAGEYRQRFGP
jgi:hypothetical protein